MASKLPLNRNIRIYQGSRYEFSFRLKSGGVPVQIDGYTAEMVILNADGTEAARLNTANGGVTIDEAEDRVIVAVPAPETLDIPVTSASYGLYLTPTQGSNYRKQYYIGTVTVIKEGDCE